MDFQGSLRDLSPPGDGRGRGASGKGGRRVGLAYLGPETYLPLASVAAGAVGLILTFWRRLVVLIRTYRQRFVGFLGRAATRLLPWGRK